MIATDYTLAQWTKSYGTTVPAPPDICVTHNAGLFSCCTIRLIFAMIFYKAKNRMPIIDSSRQFVFYKDSPHRDLTPLLFKVDPPRMASGSSAPLDISTEPGEISFTDYSKLNFHNVQPFIEDYFSPSPDVEQRIEGLKNKYVLDLENTCAVFYRGNDKMRETPEIPYGEFIGMAKSIAYHHYTEGKPHLRFFVMPDETEFIEAFCTELNNVGSELLGIETSCIVFDETRHMSKKNSAVFYELPTSERPQHAVQFLSEVYIASQCKYLITHSGNGGMWAVLFRGHANNVYQWLEGKWL